MTAGAGEGCSGGLGAVRLMVLQPFVSFKDPLAPEERAFTAYAYRDRAMRSLYDHAATALADLARADACVLERSECVPARYSRSARVATAAPVGIASRTSA
jgi:hypothetical protein